MQIRGAKYADIWGKCPAKRAHQPGIMIHFYISCEILAWGRFIVLFMDHAVALAPSVNLLGESHLAISLMDADGSKEWEIDAARNPAKNKLCKLSNQNIQNELVGLANIRPKSRELSKP